MTENEEKVREVVKGLGSLVMLSEWLLSLTRDLREKARGLLPAGEEDPPDDPLLGRPE
ncbi:MAG: hypothetical protein WBD63_06625 [Phycisphaerae bacterium]